jgi:hypothetical protein
MCDLAHVCQLDGCAQRLGSAKHQRMLGRRTAFDVRTQPLAACEVGDSARVFEDALDECFRAKKDVAMTGNYAAPEVTIRSYQDSPICDVGVVVRGQEMVLRCRDYRQAMRWARIERKTHKIPEPDVDIATKAEAGGLPLFLRSDRN